MQFRRGLVLFSLFPFPTPLSTLFCRFITPLSLHLFITFPCFHSAALTAAIHKPAACQEWTNRQTNKKEVGHKKHMRKEKRKKKEKKVLFSFPYFLHTLALSLFLFPSFTMYYLSIYLLNQYIHDHKILNPSRLTWLPNLPTTYLPILPAT
ncbi:hypothetical protein F5X96DRAFT_105494 [Biscogniauxia mediterranea]|nr:hypothetical protein F5X96DRAFT_105494 [Biscogniauxia mediterranea]